MGSRDLYTILFLHEEKKVKVSKRQYSRNLF